MINKSKFYNPPPKFRQEFLGHKQELIKDWFNIDLIYIANASKFDVGYIAFYYDTFCNMYEFNVPFDEILSKFRDYPKDDFDLLLRDCTVETQVFRGLIRQ